MDYKHRKKEIRIQSKTKHIMKEKKRENVKTKKVKKKLFSLFDVTIQK